MNECGRPCCFFTFTVCFCRECGGGGANGAGIGGGHDDEEDAGTVTITGGAVVAQGGSGAPDIGFGPSGANGTVAISGGIFWKEPKDSWLAPTYAAAPNPDEATKADYPWTVLPPFVVTVGTLSNMTAAWTGGDAADSRGGDCGAGGRDEGRFGWRL